MSGIFILDELVIARAEGQFKKISADYGKADLLILDDWLLKPLTRQEAYDLLEIIERRTKRSNHLLLTVRERGMVWPP